MTRRYISFDCEFAWDEGLHEAHRSFDKTSNRHAMAVKVITAISAFEYTIDDDGELNPGILASWTSYQWGDEAAVVEQFSIFLDQHPDHSIVGYGSIAVDLPILTMAAMAAGIQLPIQLRDRTGRWDRRHIDLGLLLKGRGKSWTHLSQLAIRLNVPAALLANKTDVPVPKSPVEWKALQDHVELDVLLLTLMWCSWMGVQNEVELSYNSCASTLLNYFPRRRPDHLMAEYIFCYSLELQAASLVQRDP